MSDRVEAKCGGHTILQIDFPVQHRSMCLTRNRVLTNFAGPVYTGYQHLGEEPSWLSPWVRRHSQYGAALPTVE